MRFLKPSELLAWKAPYHVNIISNNILIDQGTLGIYGAEGSWKSMVVQDMAFKIACGMDWFGYHTTCCSLAYFQTENPQTQLQERVRKYMIGNQNASDNLWLCTELYAKIDKGWSYTELEKEIARTMPKGLIVDPLNVSISANINDDYESGLAIDRFNMLRDKYKLAIILVHHERKMEHTEGQQFHYGTDEWGGSGRWKKWLDTIIYMQVVNDADPMVDLKLTFEKTRHAESKLQPIEIRANRLDLTITRRVAGGVL